MTIVIREGTKSRDRHARVFFAILMALKGANQIFTRHAFREDVEQNHNGNFRRAFSDLE